MTLSSDHRLRFSRLSTKVGGGNGRMRRRSGSSRRAFGVTGSALRRRGATRFRGHPCHDELAAKHRGDAGHHRQMTDMRPSRDIGQCTTPAGGNFVHGKEGSWWQVHGSCILFCSRQHQRQVRMSPELFFFRHLQASVRLACRFKTSSADMPPEPGAKCPGDLKT